MPVATARPARCQMKESRLAPVSESRPARLALPPTLWIDTPPLTVPPAISPAREVKIEAIGTDDHAEPGIGDVEAGTDGKAARGDVELAAQIAEDRIAERRVRPGRRGIARRQGSRAEDERGEPAEIDAVEGNIAVYLGRFGAQSGDGELCADWTAGDRCRPSTRLRSLRRRR